MHLISACLIVERKSPLEKRVYQEMGRTGDHHGFVPVDVAAKGWATTLA